jgi:RNA polymerase sigma-70 factor (ECF subfamily)
MTATELEAWIEAARGGNKDALGQALVSIRDYLLLVANEQLDATLQAKGGASDLVQETFFRAQRGFGAFRGRSAAEWRAWLRRILLRHLANERRRFHVAGKRRVQREVSLQSGMPLWSVGRVESPSRDLARREQETALLEALARLPEHYREVVIGHHRQKLAFDEIGKQRGISAEAARKLWSRALLYLKKELGPIGDSRS